MHQTSNMEVGTRYDHGTISDSRHSAGAQGHGHILTDKYSSYECRQVLGDLEKYGAFVASGIGYRKKNDASALPPLTFKSIFFLLDGGLTTEVTTGEKLHSNHQYMPKYFLFL